MAAPLVTTAAKLEALRGSMATIATDMDRELAARREQAALIMADAVEEVALMEQNVLVEARRRAEAEDGMREYIERVLAAASSKLDEGLGRRMDVMADNAALLERKVAQLESDLQKQRTRDERLVADLQALTAKLTESISAEVAAERSERVQFSAGMVQKMRAEVARFTERLQLESQSRERVGATLIDGVRSTARLSVRAADDKVKATLVAELDELKGDLAGLKAARFREEENLSDIMRQLVAQVEDGVRSAAVKQRR
jgi:seryl-tRNA synthetase